MLGGLGRWLRAAGYDTVIATDGRPDGELVGRCAVESRWLLTRDRGIPIHYPGKADVLLVEAQALDDAVAEVTARLDVDWLHRPFARCLLCNTPLEQPHRDETPPVPGRIREAGVELRHCPCCDKYYWEGGHVERMRRRLSMWNKRVSRMTPPAAGE